MVKTLSHIVFIWSKYLSIYQQRNPNFWPTTVAQPERGRRGHAPHRNKLAKIFTGVLYQFSTVRKMLATDNVTDWPLPDKMLGCATAQPVSFLLKKHTFQMFSRRARYPAANMRKILYLVRYLGVLSTNDAKDL